MRKLAVAVIGFALLLWTFPAANAQTVTGQVSGTVTDPSGALIASAKVTLTNTTTNRSRTIVTGVSGTFTFTTILPGTYNLTIEAPGFNTYSRPGLVVATSESVALHQIKLHLGSVSQEVTVSAQANRVETNTSSVTGLVTPTEITSMPNSGRNYLATLRTLPGVTEGSGGGTPTINGGQSGQALVQLDGIGFADNGVQRTGGNYTPNVEVISQIKVMLSNYSAEYGARAGGLINVTTKSGTSQFHGSAYYFLKNEYFDARNYFNATRSRDRFNNPGYTIGGPIYLPGTNFNKNHDKLFFFWSQEWLPTSGTSGVGYLRVPTQAERNGDFSADLAPNGIYPGSAALSSLTCPDGSTMTGGLVSSCSGYPINAATQEYMNALFPLPNNCSSATTALCTANRANDSYVTSSKNTHNQQMLRIDWAVSSNTSFYVRGLRDYQNATTTADTNQTCLNFNGVGTRSCSWPTLPSARLSPSWGLVASIIHTFSPTVVNNFTIGTNRNFQNFSAPAADVAKASRSALGITLPEFLPAVNQLELAPYATFNDPSFGPAPSFNGADLRYPFNGRQYQNNLDDNLSWVRGKSTYNFGIYVEMGLRNAARESSFNGTYSFNNDNTDPQNTNYSFANALLGIITGNGYSESNKLLKSHGRYRNIDWYVQDDWQATRRLTINAGIRFQFVTPTWSSNDTLPNFLPAAYEHDALNLNPLIQPHCMTSNPCSGSDRVGFNPVTGAYVSASLIGDYAPDANGNYPGALYPGMRLFPVGANAVKQPTVGYGPRFGFAWDVLGDGSTAVRGGFGMFYDRNVGDDIFLQLLQQPPNLLTYSLSSTTVSTLQNLCATGCKVSSLYLGPGDINSSSQYAYKMPQTYDFSLGVQRSLSHGILLDVSYQGTLGRHLRMGQNINAMPYGTLFPSNANFDPNAIDPTTGGPVTGNYAASITPYKGEGPIAFATFDGSSNYHSLRVRVNKRFGSGLTFSGTWTYSKVLSYGTGGFFGGSWAAFLPRRRQYGPASTDRRHNFVINWTYRLPSASNVWDNYLVREALDGWQVSGLATFQTGAPQTVSYSAAGNSNPTGGLPGGRPPFGAPGLTTAVNFVSNAAAVTNATRTQSHLNPNSIAAPDLSQSSAFPGLGNASLKDVFTGPGLNNWDVSIFKRFALGTNETRNLELRMETYNTWNHTQFSRVSSHAVFAGPNQVVSNLGQYTRANNARTMQMGITLHF